MLNYLRYWLISCPKMTTGKLCLYMLQIGMSLFCFSLRLMEFVLMCKCQRCGNPFSHSYLQVEYCLSLFLGLSTLISNRCSYVKNLLLLWSILCLLRISGWSHLNEAIILIHVSLFHHFIYNSLIRLLSCTYEFNSVLLSFDLETKIVQVTSFFLPF